MNTAELAQRLAGDHDLPQKKARELLDAAFDAIAEAVRSGEEVSIPGFGKFRIKERAERDGRNPATGEAIRIAASRNVAFAIAKPLRDSLNPAGGGGGGGAATKGGKAAGGTGKAAAPARASAPARKTAAKKG